MFVVLLGMVKKKTKLPSLAKLRRLADRIWAAKVKAAFGNKCAVCGVTESLNSHHIEPRTSNATLRWDVLDGISLCVTHHKYGKDAAHKSTIFFYEFIKQIIPLAIEHIKPLREIQLKANDVPREELGKYLKSLWADITEEQEKVWNFSTAQDLKARWDCCREEIPLAKWEAELLQSLQKNQESTSPV